MAVQDDRRRPLLLGLALAVAAAGCAGDDRAPPIRNVVLFSIDTLRPDHLGLYGYQRPTSPTIDGLGEAGVTFDQAIAQAPWTAPSHAAMLTSLYPSVLRIGTFKSPGRINPAAVTLAEVLRDAGFRTHGVAGFGFTSAELGFDQGFEEYEMRGRMRHALERALAWLRQIGDAERFFLFLHTYDVHRYEPPPAYHAAWVRPYRGPLAAESEIARVLQEFTQRERARSFTAADWGYVQDLYDACIRHVDDSFGRLLAYLDERGLREQTLIVVTSDHGEEFGEHGGSGHGYTLYDENVRVPLVFHHPALPRSRIDQQVRLLDLAPTITDLVGVAPAPGWQGISLVPMMHGARNRLVAFSEGAHIPLKSMRTPEQKYVVWPQQPYERLFDLRTDPTEQRDVLADASPDRVEAMRAALAERVRANLAERRYGRAEAELSETTLEHLAQLGYLGDSGGEPLVEGEDWLKLLQAIEERSRR